MNNENPLAIRIREVLKQHQRDGLSVIGNVDRLIGSLVRAVEAWKAEEKLLEKKTA